MSISPSELRKMNLLQRVLLGKKTPLKNLLTLSPTGFLIVDIDSSKRLTQLPFIALSGQRDLPRRLWRLLTQITRNSFIREHVLVSMPRTKAWSRCLFSLWLLNNARDQEICSGGTKMTPELRNPLEFEPDSTAFPAGRLE